MISIPHNHQPDAIMEDVIATNMSKSGQIKLRVLTPKITHYAEQDSAEIASPTLTLFKPHYNPWSIHSNYAHSSQGIEKILFWNHVVIHHEADEKDPNTTMLTDHLTVQTNAELALTKEAVTITQPDSVVHAVGMLANLENGSVTFLSQAQGEYTPKD